MLGFRTEESGCLTGPGLNGHEGELAPESTIHSPSAAHWWLQGTHGDVPATPTHQTKYLTASLCLRLLATGPVHNLCPLFIHEY